MQFIVYQLVYQRQVWPKNCLRFVHGEKSNENYQRFYHFKFVHDNYSISTTVEYIINIS